MILKFYSNLILKRSGSEFGSDYRDHLYNTSISIVLYRMWDKRNHIDNDIYEATKEIVDSIFGGEICD